MQQYFFELAEHIQGRLGAGEDFTATLAGERSDFVRFNDARVRQAGNVAQSTLSLRLLRGTRQASTELPLSGAADQDRARLEHELIELRGLLADAAEDPHLLLNTEPASSQHVLPGRLPETAEMVETIVAAAAGEDLVGFLAAGPVFAGFANSYGQRNWQQSSSFNFDWSLYAGGDKAIKCAYAGTDWSAGELRARQQAAAAQLELLRRPARRVPPGGYRAYLAPAALNELIDMLNWGGFSEKALRAKSSPLLRLAEGAETLHPAVSLAEHTAEGLAPAFQSEGFVRPGRTALIDQGRLAGSLVSPRTAREYGLITNGADASESVQALQMAAGELPAARVLAELGSGLYIGNLWYCNFSDRAQARLTGMTRFASFWVEDGQIVAPLEVMRFDDSLYRMLGSQLAGLTRERELIMDTATYEGRSTASRLLPGALLEELRLVL